MDQAGLFAELKGLLCKRDRYPYREFGVLPSAITNPLLHLPNQFERYLNDCLQT